MASVNIHGEIMRGGSLDMTGGEEGKGRELDGWMGRGSERYRRGLQQIRLKADR